MRILGFIAFTLFGVALFSAEPAQADGRTTLVSMNGDGIRFVLGVLMTQGVCEDVAYRLNFYAQLPPEDPIRFYCRSSY